MERRDKRKRRTRFSSKEDGTQNERFRWWRWSPSSSNQFQVDDVVLHSLACRCVCLYQKFWGFFICYLIFLSIFSHPTERELRKLILCEWFSDLTSENHSSVAVRREHTSHWVPGKEQATRGWLQVSCRRMMWCMNLSFWGNREKIAMITSFSCQRSPIEIGRQTDSDK